MHTCPHPLCISVSSVNTHTHVNIRIVLHIHARMPNHAQRVGPPSWHTCIRDLTTSSGLLNTVVMAPTAAPHTTECHACRCCPQRGLQCQAGAPLPQPPVGGNPWPLPLLQDGLVRVEAGGTPTGFAGGQQPPAGPLPCGCPTSSVARDGPATDGGHPMAQVGIYEHGTVRKAPR